MAVAAYGSLVSLLNVLDNVQYRAQIRNIHVDINLIESLQEGINYLVEYVEVHSEKEGVVDLWRQLSRMAFEAEEMFDLHVVDQLQLKSQGQKGDLGFLAFNEDVETVIQQVDLIKKELLVVKDVQNEKQSPMAAPVGDSSSSIPFSSGKSTMVGFDHHLEQIMDRLTSDQRHRQIIPIVGMGGIGKTTLALNVFNNPLIVERFDLRIWLTISQEYSVHQILLGLLNDGVVQEKDFGGNFHELGENLYKKLYGRRYLIVMDDVWGIEAWNDLRVFFPNYNNGSRIMMTTRLAVLATSLGCEDSYVVTFLDEDQSWNLFCQTTFAQESCPYPEFEEIGRSIAASCKGLPLEIVVIGSHLANSDMTKKSWEFVAENMKSFGDIDDYQHCMEVLYLSYKKLPIHLKLCFLYMRLFPEDAEIDTDDLTERWIAEGYIKSNNGKDLLEIGMKYLKDLTARNLIGRSNSKYVAPSLKEVAEGALHMHDLFRDLCIREWNKEQYICSPKIQIFELIQRNVQDACIHCGTLHSDAEAKNLLDPVVISPTTSEVSFVICRDCEVMYSNLKRPRLVKVAVVQNDSFIKELVHPTQLRYAMTSVQSCIFEYVSPCMLQLLWNLQSLRFSSSRRSPIVLPPEIWELPQLRRIQSVGRQYLVLPNPTDTHEVGEDFIILKNLSSLWPVHDFECTKEILNRIPNLKLLKIKYEQELEDMQRLHNSLCNLIHLQKLEFLYIKDAALEHAIFPKSLKHLRLRRCKISWKDITITIGSLPSLEGLYLFKSGEGTDWTPVDGEFLQLKMLRLESCDLRCWNADQVHYPKLEWVVLKGLTLLEKVPLGMGDIATLQLVDIEDCNEDVNESVKKIWEEQQSMGNESLQIVIDGEQYLGEDEI